MTGSPCPCTGVLLELLSPKLQSTLELLLRHLLLHHGAELVLMPISASGGWMELACGCEPCYVVLGMLALVWF